MKLFYISLAICLAGIHFAKAQADVKSQVFFIYYNGNSLSQYVNISLTNPAALVTDQTFDKNRPTDIYIPGFTETTQHPTVKKVMSSYITEARRNIVLIDWSILSNVEYLEAVQNVNRVGEILPEALEILKNNGLDLSTLSVVGYSLGAQIASRLGYGAKQRNIRLPRILGLDPAFPGYYFTAEKNIESTDAEFVYCLHTDAGVYGTPFPYCHADFWPNEGTRYQPGCPITMPLVQRKEDFCSHNRSPFIYAESILNPNNFSARKCDSYSQFSVGLCATNPKVLFNTETPRLTRGNYYFKTKSTEPFGMGYSGLYV